MDLFHLCLTSSYFQYNGKHYRRDSSVAVGEVAMHNIEEQALATYKTRLPFLSRYVDITLMAVCKGQTEKVHKHLNKQNADTS